MRTSLNTNILAGIVGLALLVMGAFFAFNQAQMASAGSIEGDYATTTTSAMASATATVQLREQAGALGSIIVGSSSPATVYSQISIYDATSTMATSSSKVLFRGNSMTAGSYIIDAAAAYGLKVEVGPGYNGNATITWR